MMNFCSLYKSDLKRALDKVANLKRMEGAKVLVTGASGLIGSASVDMLLAANDVFNTNLSVFAAGRSLNNIKRRFNYYSERRDLEFLEFNAAEYPQWEIDFDYIIHAASPAHPAAFLENPVETMLANIAGTNNLLDHSKNHGVRRFLYISSSEIYGQNDSDEAHKESEYGYVDVLNSRACYPSSKRAAETLCASYRSEYAVDTVIVRPGHVYGPTAVESDNRVSSAFIRDAIEGRDIILKSAGTQLRSYCYIVDCVSAILTVLLNGEAGQAYNISNRHSIVTIRQFAELIAGNSDSKVVFANPTDREKGAFNPMSNSSLNSEKIEALGWQGLFDAETGIKHTLEIMRFQKE